jgi:hypothetical protein
MPLISAEPRKFEVTLWYVEKEDGIEIVERPGAAQPGDKPVKEERFWFKVPTWGEARLIMSGSVTVKQDKISVDPFRLTDVRMKTLLMKWTLKDEKGADIPVSNSNIEKLPPMVVTYLNAQLDKVAALATAFGSEAK